MLKFLVLLKRPTFSHKLACWYIWIYTKKKMGNRRSAYPWIQRIPAKPQFWCGANVSSFTPNMLLGVFITSCSLNRGTEDSYEFMICCLYNAGPPARSLVPSPCPRSSPAIHLSFLMSAFVHYQCTPTFPLPLTPTGVVRPFHEHHKPSASPLQHNVLSILSHLHLSLSLSMANAVLSAKFSWNW